MIKPRLIDSHSHLQFSDYDKNRKTIIEESLLSNIWMVNTGSSIQTSKEAIDLSEQYESGVYATLGIHPSHIEEGFNHNKMLELARHEKCVAIGECGLEYFLQEQNGESYFNAINQKLQSEIFIKHIYLAHSVKKPLVIHCRDAYEDLYKIMQENINILLPRKPALMHFFAGSLNSAQKFLDMDFMFSFGGAITFPPKPHKTDFVSLIKKIPIESILLETDCPYVSPVPVRKEKNKPMFITYISQKIAEIKNMKEEEVAEITTNNAINFFAINQ